MKEKLEEAGTPARKNECLLVSKSSCQTGKQAAGCKLVLFHFHSYIKETKKKLHHL